MRWRERAPRRGAEAVDRCGRKKVLLAHSAPIVRTRQSLILTLMARGRRIANGSMTLSTRQIEFLARAIVNRLEDRGLVEFGDAEAGIDIVTRVLSDNFRAAEQIEHEARERLKNLDRGCTQEELDLEMRKVAAEKSFAL